jgi:asparagine synthase (glutamine-hydrolysing)
VARDLADEMADDPLRWDRYQVVSRRRRAVDLTVQTLGTLAELEGARYVAPFLDEGFLASLAAWGGRFGHGDRTAVMRALFADLLPGPITARTSKATFGGVFWGPASRQFAEEWDGTGFRPEIVDAEVLRSEWLAPVPVHGATLPLHAAWLLHHRVRQN